MTADQKAGLTVDLTVVQMVVLTVDPMVGRMAGKLAGQSAVQMVYQKDDNLVHCSGLHLVCDWVVHLVAHLASWKGCRLVDCLV